MKAQSYWLWPLVFCALMLSACYKHPMNAGPEGSATNLTVGTVQGSIKVGMPASDVAALLGSPNIVTTDENRREVWIYDKVSSSRVDTANSVFGTLIILGSLGAHYIGLSASQALGTKKLLGAGFGVILDVVGVYLVISK